MLKKIVKLLSSMRFTLWLILLLGVMFLLGLWIPQERLVHGNMLAQWRANVPSVVKVLEALQFTKIYTSVLMMTLWGLFFLNLSLVMWQRLPLIKSRISLTPERIRDPETATAYPYHAVFSLPAGLDGAGVIALLRRSGYAVLGDGAGFYGVKNRLSPIAFGLFHLSFFLILVGGLTSVYTKFVGMVDLAQGEPFQGELQRYNSPPTMPKFGGPPVVNFTIKSIDPQVTGDMATGIKVEIVEPDGATSHLDINRPYNINSTSFVFKDLGVAPLFVLKDPSGREIDGFYSKLNVTKGRQDSFTMGGFIFHTRFYPDFALVDGKPTTKSEEFNNPILALEVEKDRRKIAEGRIPKNGTLEFNGYRLEMKDMPFWIRFSVVKEYGLPVIYAGFAIASIAVIWRLLLYRRELLGAVREVAGERSLIVAGRSEFYKSLAADEFAALFEKLLGKEPKQ
jgi:cytochrome c biogenesis protein ResB